MNDESHQSGNTTFEIMKSSRMRGWYPVTDTRLWHESLIASRRCEIALIWSGDNEKMRKRSPATERHKNFPTLIVCQSEEIHAHIPSWTNKTRRSILILALPAKDLKQIAWCSKYSHIPPPRASFPQCRRWGRPTPLFSRPSSTFWNQHRAAADYFNLSLRN